jgi:hypothetical protein
MDGYSTGALVVIIKLNTHGIKTENKVVEHDSNKEVDVDLFVSPKRLQETIVHYSA